MKKLYFSIIVLFGCVITSSAQVANYSFSQTSSTYTSISGGSVVTLTPDDDDGIATSQPIGFSFNFNGINYTTFGVNSNGYIWFGTGSPDITTYSPIYTDGNLGGSGTIDGVIAPLGRDLLARTSAPTGELRIQTTGSAPNQTCIIQYSNWRAYGLGSSSIYNFQIRLNQTSNTIDFVYGAFTMTGASSSSDFQIGLRGSSNLDFKTVVASAANWAGSTLGSSNASASTLSATIYPVSGTTFTFTPAASCSGMPANGTATSTSTLVCSGNVFTLTVTGSSVASGLNYQWQSSANNSSWSDIGGATSAALNTSETANTYFRRRTSCGANDAYSASVLVNYTTTLGLPYSLDFENVATPGLPSCFTVSDANTDGVTWFTLNNGTYASNGTKSIVYSYNADGVTAADDWFFLGPFTLTSGTSYKVQFKYRGGGNPTWTEAMEVKYGNAPTAAGMTSAPLFTNPSFSTATYANVAAAFIPSSSGNYYIGFHAMSAADQNLIAVDEIYFNTGVVFPVTINSFTGEKLEGSNLLRWSTSTETNNKGFELQRSADGKTYSTIGFIASSADNGNSNTVLNYSYKDEKPLSGSNYYRLKQTDKDGKYNLSSVVVLKSKITEITLSSVYPNPAKSLLNVVITSPSAEKVTVLITDLTGKVVMQQPAQLTIGDNQQQLNIQKLSAGNYLIKTICSSGCETPVQRFVKN